VRHLNPGTFVDILDGTVAESAVPHLASCDQCREQLSEVRTVWQAAADVDVPEPSPLFWDHLSARVREVVVAEPRRPLGWREHLRQPWRVAALAGATAALIVVAVVQFPTDRAGGTRPVRPPAASINRAALAPVERLADDDMLAFVADLAGNLDWDDASDIGLAVRGVDERAVADMTDVERRELHRLLTEALGNGSRTL
jgi:hypothetical protein